MGRDFRDVYTVVKPENMSSIEEWAWDSFLIKPEAFWDLSSRAFLLGAAAAAAAFGIAIAVYAIKRRHLVANKLFKRKVCLVKEQGTDTTAEAREVVELKSGEQPPPAEKSGYVFLGWYYDRQYTSPVMPFDTIKAKTILYAKWGKEGD